jgi:SAM-dependent methyltransferase
MTHENVDQETIASFGDEWTRFDQSAVSELELRRFFDAYFSVFPWDRLPDTAQGFDMGCGTGRWARFVAPRVGVLHCIEPSAAIEVARKTLGAFTNVVFHEATVDTVGLAVRSQDFGYSLGVLHHIPDTRAAMRRCVALLKPRAPFLVYLYYRFDNRPTWFKALWHCSNLARKLISALPTAVKRTTTDAIAILVYWPLARFAGVVERLGFSAASVPLYSYRKASLYTMRTDSRDRFGTPLEHRFTKIEIETMMRDAGLSEICFRQHDPYWVAVGYAT